MHARYFSMHLGRFHSVDAVGGVSELPQSWNRYSYVLGNPVKYIDPRGEFAELGLQALSDYFKCLESGECANEVIDVTDQFDPLTGVIGHGDLLAGSAFMLGLSGGGGRLPGLNAGGQDPFRLNLYERVVSGLEVDGLEFGRCIEQNRFDLGKAVTAFDVGNPIANRLAGSTGRMGFGGLGPHATTWQHKVGANLSRTFKNPAFSRVGKFAGRAALVPTVFEGFYDIGTIGRCAVVTGGN
jgi:hypothetical protein